VSDESSLLVGRIVIADMLNKNDDFVAALREAAGVIDAQAQRIARLERVLAAVDARMDVFADKREVWGNDYEQIRRVIAAALGGES
jgi:ABC-type transporter Mla subunit MlaD